MGIDDIFYHRGTPHWFDVLANVSILTIIVAALLGIGLLIWDHMHPERGTIPRFVIEQGEPTEQQTDRVGDARFVSTNKTQVSPFAPGTRRKVSR